MTEQPADAESPVGAPSPAEAPGERSRSPLQFTPEVAWRLLHGLSTSAVGADELATLVAELRSTLAVDFAFAAELRNTAPLRARTLHVEGPEGPRATTEYDLDGTPCLEVLAHGYHHVDGQAQRCFPRDRLVVNERIDSFAGIVLPAEDGAWLGWIGVMARGRLADAAAVRAALELVSARFRLLLRLHRQQAELTRARAEAALLTSHDRLTGFPNRAAFMDRLEALAGACQGPLRNSAVLILDLDRFTRVNDGLGRAAGDALLHRVARCLRAAVGAGSFIARLDGDEFGILLEGVNSVGEAGGFADRMLAALDCPDLPGVATPLTTGSIGIALGPANTGAELARRAEIALHHAKARGRARWEVFDAVMHHRAVERLEVEAGLRRALESDELRVVYQPIHALASGRVAGVEALARWRPSNRGEISPEVFVPVAEDSGLILPLGAWVLRRVGAELAAWPARHALSVAVNLSARQFRDPGLLPALRAIAPPSGSPTRLRLEITESAVMEDPESAVKVLDSIHRLGITICIDDFGTGYSSLAQLLRLPVDALKIDRLFVRDLETRASSRRLVAAITRLAHELGLDVIAEGVETEEQRRHVEDLGVDLVQGFLFARPLEQEAVLTALR